MTSNLSNPQVSVDVLKTDSARQRWEWFHRAIALAKQSNSEALETEEPLRTADGKVRREDSRLSIAR